MIAQKIARDKGKRMARQQKRRNPPPQSEKKDRRPCKRAAASV
jgi:hypothetical protein